MHTGKLVFAQLMGHLPPVVFERCVVLLGGRIVFRVLSGSLTLQRGMSFWYDFLDWMGGYPFEVASVRAILDFFSPLGFHEQKVLGRCAPTWVQ
jgi:hypothetical protein